MIISDSNVSMSSTRQYSHSGSKGKGISGATSPGSTVGSFQTYKRDFYSGREEDFMDMYENFAKNPATTRNVSTAGFDNNPLMASPLQNSILTRLLQRIMGISMSTNMSPREVGIIPLGNGGFNTSLTTYSEHENVNFYTEGQAKTADGRIIDFNIELEMSRSYMEYTNLQVNPVRNALIDPLVINVDSGITKISDQKFMFDLDADGKEEEISMLGKGSGFLTIDLNEDGVINDGRELFGAKTGDGFGELRSYDSDGNGWIDEADEVFSRLKVWCKSENGEDILMDLKEAGVGAIFLGSTETEFSSYGESGLRGVIRSTGFFLKEEGGAGTIQHVDLATNNADQKIQESAKSNKGETGFGFIYDNQSIVSIELSDISRRDNLSLSHRDELKKSIKARKERLSEQKKELNNRLLKKRIEKKQMLDKQMDNIRRKRKEHSKQFEPDYTKIESGNTQTEQDVAYEY